MARQRARVTEDHRAPDRPAIQVASGERVTLGDRDTEWPEFVWTALANGLGGWVPTTLFDAERGQAMAMDAYDTTELNADAGDIVVVERELADWWWAIDAHGNSGWLPARKLDLVETQ